MELSYDGLAKFSRLGNGSRVKAKIGSDEEGKVGTVKGDPHADGLHVWVAWDQYSDTSLQLIERLDELDPQ